MNSNPLIPVFEAYEVSTDCFKVAKRAVKQQQSNLFADSNWLTRQNAHENIDKTATEVSDLFVFSLWAAFERFIITYLQTKAIGLQKTVVPITLANPLSEYVQKEMEYWTPKDILDLLKNVQSIDKNTIGKTKQILEYRNWIAHGKDMKKTSSVKAMTPIYTYQTLNEIVNILLLN
jgi:hypothetical protein